MQEKKMLLIILRILYLYLIIVLNVTVSFNIDVNSPIIYEGQKDSYFGYTVGLVKNDQGSWVLVGAPKSNDSYQLGIESPGALYKCRYPKTDSCEQINVDDSGNSEQKLKFQDRSVLLHHQKDNQWLGVSLDVNPVNMGSIVVCAHRWRDSYLERNVKSISHMNGFCYRLAANLSSPGQPIPALTKWHRLVHSAGYAVFSMGTLGMSARFSENEDLILMGAPGLNDFTGGAVIDKDTEGGVWDYIEPPRNTYQNDYIGYAMTTGRFIYRGTYSVALGAPRADGTGKVLVYRLSPITEMPASSVNGEQLGSYFGSALCVINYDDDHYDDLLIGAPMYAENGQIDQGRVYIYISTGPMGFRKADLVLKGSDANFARFGSAIVNLGDINLDGFKDIAVGAPYEDDSHGAVYIYNGYRDGLWPDYTQRISAKTLNANLLGFGISFSRPYDIDRNGCNDIAVGSYLSNHAVLLRARPVINVTATLELMPKAVDPDTNCNIIGMRVPCIRVKICFFYSGVGEGIPTEIEMNYTLTFDSERVMKVPRVIMPIMTADGLQEVTSISGDKVVYQNMWDCNVQHTVYVKSVMDKNEDIAFDLKYSASSNVTSNCEICSAFSVFNGALSSGLQQYHIKENSTFLRNCGEDHICYSNLSLSGMMVFPPLYGNEYIMNETANFSLNMTLENFGEKAYDTRIIFVVPSNIEFRQIKIANDINFIIPCTIKEQTSGENPTETEIDCVIDEVERVRLMLLAEFATIKEFTTPRFHMKFKVETSSSDVNVDHNEVHLDVAVKRLSEVAIYGAAVPDQLNFRSGLNVSDVYNFTHIYELYNKGPNILNKGHIIFRFPTITGSFSIHLEMIDIDWGINKKCLVKGLRENGFAVAPLFQEFLGRPIMTIACHNRLCTRIICPVAEMPRDGKVKYIVRMHMLKNVTDMFKASGKWLNCKYADKDVKNIEYISDATFEYLNVTENIIQKGKLHLKVVTDITLPKMTKMDQKFHLWIIIVSVVCGLLCFLTFSVLLWKCGFFKRQQREDLQRLIEHRNTLSRSRHSDNSLESSDNEGSHENLVMTTPLDFQDVTENGYYGSHVNGQNGYRSTMFDNNNQYLEPIQRLL